ncbi:uncharacterized protein [Eucyclogobius newberryi]|uniref:uncharacterized protein n=1 Tax=Eucyclogobius newberryi TaxID=166745 RepID=UPI003B5B3329
MVKGMKGYQLTPADLEFMQTLKGEKELKKVQEDLKTVQNTLKGEMMVLELALASMEKAQTELKLLPPCEDIRQWSEVLLEMSVPSSDLSELDTKALLALVTQNDAKTAIQYKKAELKLMEQMVENRSVFLVF